MQLDWTRPLGFWRTEMLWRLFGLCVLLSFLHALGGFGDAVPWRFVPYSVYLCCAAALYLIFFGPSLLRLLFLMLCLFAYFIPVMTEWVWFQLSEEFGLFLALPVLGFLFAAVVQLRDGNRQEEDSMQVLLFRWAALLVLTFACLHKINADFFDPKVSCGVLLPQQLPQWWALPFPRWMQHAPPFASMLLEGLIPFFLVVYPAAGLILGYAFLGLVGMIGPAPFTLTVMTCASAFLHEEDGQTIREGIKRSRLTLAAIALLLLAFSWKTYRGPQWWAEMALYQVTVFFLFCGVFFAVRRSRPRATVRFLGGLPLFPSQMLLRGMVVFLILGGLINGLTPYLGWKYRLSFAMLSNLRADQTRWNSYVFPKALYTRKHDPFIRILDIEMSHEDRDKLTALPDPYQRAVFPGLFSPMSLLDRLNNLKEAGIHVKVSAQFQNEKQIFEDAAFNETCRAWVAQKPQNKWFQEWLTLQGPQPCIH